MTAAAPEKKNRWYDKFPELAALLEVLKHAGDHKKSAAARGINALIHKEQPHVAVGERPVEAPIRRWYDADPAMWKAITGMSFCDTEVVQKAISYLATELEEQRMAEQNRDGKG